MVSMVFVMLQVKCTVEASSDLLVCWLALYPGPSDFLNGPGYEASVLV